jgi:pimeloyl-ACP methyl ester carboxylesterase
VRDDVVTVTSSNGIEIAVHDLGGDGPPVLLCHATGFCGLVWRPFAASLAGVRSLALDFRGHGLSRAPDDHHFDWNRFADDVLAVVDALDLAGCPAVGHSKGGASLLLAEQRRPGTFSGLWCYEPVVFPSGPIPARANPLAAGARKRRASFPSRRAAFDNFHQKPPLSALAPEALDGYLDGGFSVEHDGSLTLRCLPEHEARVYEMGGQHDAFAHLAEVTTPTTIARGRIEAGPAMFAEQIASRLPHGSLEVYEHLGHFGPLESPAEMGAAASRALRLG